MIRTFMYSKTFLLFYFLFLSLSHQPISQIDFHPSSVLEKNEMENSCENLALTSLMSGDTASSNIYANDCYKSKNWDVQPLNKVYFLLAHKFYEDNKTRNAIILFDYCKQLSEKSKDKLTYAKAVLHISEIYISEGKNFDISIKDCQEVEEIARSISDSSLLSESLFYLGEAYMIQSEYIKSLEAHYESYKIRSQMNDLENISISKVSLGSLYCEIKNYEMALQFHSDNIQYLKSHNDLQNLGMTYLNIGQIYQAQNKHKDAFDYFKKALNIFESNEFTPKFYTREHYIADVKNNIGWNFNVWGKPEKALPYLKASLAIKEKEGNPRMLSYVCHTLGETYFKLGQFNESQRYYDWTLKLILEVGLKKELVVLYDNLSKLANARNNFQQAYEYKNKSVLIKDSLFSEKKLEAMNQFDIAFENEKKKLEKDFLQQQLLVQKQLVEKQNMILISISLGLLIFFGMFIYLIKMNDDKKLLNRDLSAKNEEIFAQNEEISAQNKEITWQKDTIESALKEIEELNATKDRFFSIIAHDLRGPLSSLSAFSSLLVEHTDSLSIEDIKSVGLNLNAEVKNTIDLTDNLLAWAKNQMKKSTFNPVVIQLDDVISQIIGFLKLTAQNKGIELIMNIDEPIAVHADIDQVNFIIRNLISNSIKFTFPGGRIEVNYGLKENMAEISIRDTGVGMRKEVAQKIFNLDSNHSSEGTEGEKGTGLGLSLCRDFVELNGGKIWVESEKGKGSIFSFSLKTASTLVLEA